MGKKWPLRKADRPELKKGCSGFNARNSIKGRGDRRVWRAHWGSYMKRKSGGALLGRKFQKRALQEKASDDGRGKTEKIGSLHVARNGS